jgi:membrane protein DedA with SNARE-associated domain
LHRALATKWGERLVRREQREWAERFVRARGWRAIVLGRFLVALRGPVYFALGASRYPPGRFLAINSSVALAEVGLVVWLGYRFGQSGALVGKVRWIDAAVAASLLIAFVIPWLFTRWLKRGSQRAGASHTSASNRPLTASPDSRTRA